MPPSSGGRQGFEEMKSRHYAYLSTFRGWVESAYILSCAPPLAGRERATKWRGGICRWHASAGSYKNGAPYFQRAPPSFTIFKRPLPPLRGPPSPGKQGEARLRREKPPPLCLLVHPRLGVGGERQRDGRGRLPQEAIKMAPHISKGRHLHLPFTTYHF